MDLCRNARRSHLTKTKTSAGPRCGFTIIELLIVIAVIVVLAAILFPVLASVRQRSRSTACASNLRQLYLAVAQYAADDNNILPPYPTHFNMGWASGAIPPGDPSGDHAAQLVKALHPYTGSKDLWFCPNDTFARTDSTEGFVNHRYTSYATSLYWYEVTTDLWPILGQTPFDHPLGFSGKPLDPTQVFLFTDDLWACKPTSYAEPALPYSHQGRFNAVALDGHMLSFARDQQPVCGLGGVE